MESMSQNPKVSHRLFFLCVITSESEAATYDYSHDQKPAWIKNFGHVLTTHKFTTHNRSEHWSELSKWTYKENLIKVKDY